MTAGLAPANADQTSGPEWSTVGPRAGPRLVASVVAWTSRAVRAAHRTVGGDGVDGCTDVDGGGAAACLGRGRSGQHRGDGSDVVESQAAGAPRGSTGGRSRPGLARASEGHRTNPGEFSSGGLVLA